MRIQHNIMAMNAYRNYNTNTSALSKNLEKLSSGYKINRAGDDAAGLAISEKMRAQITGLETAQKNAKDGISLVQTAEGALTEVHDMLNRMVELATQSANGTYDNETDRANLQKEVDQLLSEINRIADSSNFNGINLLDGTMQKGFDLTQTSDVGIADEGTILGTDTLLKQESKASQATSFSIDLNDIKYSGTAGDSIELKIAGESLKITTTAGMTAADMATAFVVAAAASGGFTINGQAVNVTDAGNGRLTFTQAAAPTKADEVIDANQKVEFSITAGTTNNASIKGTLDASNQLIGAYTSGTVGGTANSTAIAALNTAGGTLTVAWSGGLSTSASATLKTIMDSLKVTDNSSNIQVKTIAGSGTNAGKMGLYLGNTLLAVSDEAVASVTTANTAGSTPVVYTFKSVVDNSEIGRLTLTSDGTATVAASKFDTGTNTGLTFTPALANVTGELSAADNDELLALAKEKGAETGEFTVSINSDGTKYILKVGDTELATAEVNASNAVNFVNGTGATILTIDPSAAVTATHAGSELKTGLTYDAGTAKGDIVGSYNVSTTVNVQGNVASDGQLASTKFTLNKDAIVNGGSLTIGKETYVFKTDKDDNSLTGNVVDLSDLNPNDADYLGKVAERISLAAANNSAFSVGAQGSDGTMTIVEKKGQSAFDLEALDSKEDIAKLIQYSGAKETGNGLTLQIGDTSDSFNQLTVDIQDMHAKTLGLEDLKIDNQTDAAAAVKKIKDAINTVSSVRGTLGATQNRLDHTINNLSVMTENIQDAESTIRDTDVAEEMMAYTKNNILVQSAQAMLAQANQVPQGVLQLLQ